MAIDRVLRLCAVRPAVAVGSRQVETEELVRELPNWNAATAINRTGVASRPWVSSGETAVGLTLLATRRLLQSLPADAPPISAILCSTTSPQEATPSIACQIATAISKETCLAKHWFSLDFNAACSGYLYGVRLAHDHLIHHPGTAVLLLTAEVLSSALNRHDPTTVFLFGDAATATLLTTEPLAGRSLSLTQPLIASASDPDKVISSPCFGTGCLRMDGIAVARTAYKAMSAILRTALERDVIRPEDLEAIVPHPGSQRILQNVADALGVPSTRIWHTLADTGNTSSSSIPVALNRFWDQLPRRGKLGLVAFGAGFTSAATTAGME